MVLSRNIFCNKQEAEEYFNYSWFLDELTGEAHPILYLEMDKSSGNYKKIVFKDKYIYQDIEYLKPANTFVIQDQENHPDDYPYLLVFSGQYIKVTGYDFFNDPTVNFLEVEYYGIDGNIPSIYTIEVITPEEYFINTSQSYRELHPDLTKKFYLGV